MAMKSRSVSVKLIVMSGAFFKGERSHFMTFNVARTLSSVEHDVYAKIDQLIEEEKK